MVVVMRFAVVPELAIRDPELTPSEFRVLVAIYCFAEKRSGVAWPSRVVLAEFLGIKNVSEVSKITARLEKKGWLKKNKKTAARGTKKYQIVFPDRLNELFLVPPQGGQTAHLGNSQGGQTAHPDNSQGGQTAHPQGGQTAHPDNSQGGLHTLKVGKLHTLHMNKPMNKPY